MAETKKPFDWVQLINMLMVVSMYLCLEIAILQPNKWKSGIIMVNDGYVHYASQTKYPFFFHYSIGIDANPTTNPQVKLCRLRNDVYARCEQTEKMLLIEPLSDFDKLIVRKLYENRVLPWRYESITYTQRTEMQ